MRSAIYFIIGLVIGLVAGGLIGYLSYSHLLFDNFNGRGNFEISEETKTEISTFFESTSDISEIEFYCQQNRNYCLYYCMNIDSSNEICTQLQSPDKRIRQ